MIYFNTLKEACSFEISEPIATVDNETWNKHCMNKAGTTWDIIDGVFVQLKDAEYVANRAKAELRIRELMRCLNDTDYQSIKHNEGLISDEDWEPIKQKRMDWRAEINELQAEYDL